MGSSASWRKRSRPSSPTRLISTPASSRAPGITPTPVGKSDELVGRGEARWGRSLAAAPDEPGDRGTTRRELLVVGLSAIASTHRWGARDDAHQQTKRVDPRAGLGIRPAAR